ncbi:MAG: quinolinate synthase NadA [Ruminococcus sp.]|nr:quinolinate synthase NadA [Ruminococcus sp.]MCD7800026.1 quinolinate synthase NadA [Ruminococcus sp.]
MIKTLQDEILQLKKDKNAVILAHCYQSKEILEVADETGDSYNLSVSALKYANCDTFIMCGVHFMAETVKILSPNKRVILANGNAGCPMAEQFTIKDVLKLRQQYPKASVVAYVNTTADLKSVCDVCVTSATSVKICEKIPNDEIIFIPDCNLGSFTAERVPNKKFIFVQGGCPIHGNIPQSDVLKAKQEHPNALVLCHPECSPKVTQYADYIGSTTGIMAYAKQSNSKEFIIGTENSIVDHLEYACPDKYFYPLSKDFICADMKLTTLPDVKKALLGVGGLEIDMSNELISKAKVCIDNMVELGR